MANDLVISVGASIRDLERQLKAASKIAEERADEIESKFRKANPTLGGDFGLGVLKGAIAAISFEKITRGFIDANKEIASFGETARRAAVDVQRFQELRLAAANAGISGKDFDSGLQGLAKELNESRREETELSKLLDANNIKIKDRRGEVVSTNEALAIAADLISRAATEQDKIEIAKRFGLPPDFLPLLEGGAEALNRLAKNAADAGVILDADVIAKAKQFDTAWDTAWNSFTTYSKSSAVQAGQYLADLIRQATDFQTRMANARGAGAEMGKFIGELSKGAELTTAPLPPTGRPGGMPTTAPRPISRPSGLAVGGATRLPAKGSGGGGSSAKSEEEQAQQRLEKYIETLMRQNAALDAQIATVGKSNAEKRAAVELAKAQTDLAKLDEDSRKKVIADLEREIGLSEQKRTVLKSLEDAQKGLRDAQKFFGDAAVDALEDLIVNGAKAEDVVKNLAAALAKAALQAALMGSGPLAGIFGAKGVDGAAGGLFGALFGRAGGGPVNAGQPYRVGERGPETFVPTSPGKIIPNARGGGGVTVSFAIDARGAGPNEVAAIRAEMARQQAALPAIILQTQAEARRRGAR